MPNALDFRLQTFRGMMQGKEGPEYSPLKRRVEIIRERRKFLGLPEPNLLSKIVGIR